MPPRNNVVIEGSGGGAGLSREPAQIIEQTNKQKNRESNNNKGAEIADTVNKSETNTTPYLFHHNLDSLDVISCVQQGHSVPDNGLECSDEPALLL